MKIIKLFFFVLLYGCSSGEDDSTLNPNPVYNYSIRLDNSDHFAVGQNLGLNYFNDITVGVLDYTQDQVRLITAAGTKSYVLQGPNLSSLNTVTEVFAPQAGTFYSNYIGLGQLIKDDTGIIYSVFHAEQHDGSTLPGGIPGFYASIGLGTSQNNGQTFELANDPIIPNIYDSSYDNQYGDGGLGEPSITFSKDSSEVFVYYVDHNRTGRGVNISMAKFNTTTNHRPDFSAPFFLNENNLFTNEVIRSKEVVIGNGNSDAIFPQVTFNKFTNLYVMVYTENNWGEYVNGISNPSLSGIYYRTSKDGIHWTSDPIQLISGWGIPFSAQNHSYLWHPNLIYTNENQSEGYLIYSKANTLQEGHKMWALRFDFEQEAQ